MGMEGGRGRRCFGLGTGLSSRGTIQKNMPVRERFGRVPQGLNVQDPTNYEGGLLLFAIHPGTASHESDLHSSWTQFSPGVPGGHQLWGHKCTASAPWLLPHTLLRLPSPP